jgi:hypothetical protein
MDISRESYDNFGFGAVLNTENDSNKFITQLEPMMFQLLRKYINNVVLEVETDNRFVKCACTKKANKLYLLCLNKKVNNTFQVSFDSFSTVTFLNNRYVPYNSRKRNTYKDAKYAQMEPIFESMETSMGGASVSNTGMDFDITLENFGLNVLTFEVT